MSSDKFQKNTSTRKSIISKCKKKKSIYIL